jgi:nucleolar protein 56
MRLLIGDLTGEHLSLLPEGSIHETGDDLPPRVLRDLAGRSLHAEYRAANLALTAKQLEAAATPDQDLIQAVHTLRAVDTAINGLGKYAAEWYALYHPADPVPGTEVNSRSPAHPGLREHAEAVARLVETRAQLLAHVESQAKAIMPSVHALVGGVVAAKLLDHAGSLERLARMPSTTIQLLGAERAFFRHLRMRDGKPPKHGVIVSCDVVQQMPGYHRGRAARVLANALAIAARVDANKGEPCGEALRRKVEVTIRARTRS